MHTPGVLRTTDADFEEQKEICERVSVRGEPFFILMDDLLVCSTSKSPVEGARRWAATLAQLLQRKYEKDMVKTLR